MQFDDNQPKSYQWLEPAWSYRPRIKTELSEILNIKLWPRVVIVVAAVTFALAYAVKRLLPDLEFDWLKALGASIGAVNCCLAAVAAILLYVPPSIKIWNKGIMRQQGSSHRILFRSDIRQITIDATNPSQVWLRVQTAKKPFECGIPAKISSTDLAQWLRESFPQTLVTEQR